ncbi:YHYH protein [uncultured Aquimarina sp.]|uniref:YHYH protein n=1 Tax=uncultured Aquimarina sp. TaxID=575652 RepID=UPI002637DC70|nr:YHYH protein [uncultured Aquimarina sp.]
MKKILPLLLLVPLQYYAQCDSSAIFAVEDDNAVCIEVVDNVRYVYSNNWPNHGPGSLNSSFTLTAQDDTWTMCAYPELNTSMSPLYGDESQPGCTETYTFGVGANGVKYDPSSAEFFENTSTGESNYDWHVEAVAALNINNQGAHLNPFGEYHYHSISTPYFTDTGGVTLGIDGTVFSPLIGYAADGYPIYYKYAYTDANDNSSSISAFDSGWQLKSGTRPGDGVSAPDGTYDGYYVEDYEFIQANTELDECNGRFGITPDFPDGTYYYVLTDSWPWIPRCFAGTFVDNSFRIGPGASCPASTAVTDCASAPLLSVTDNIQDLEEVIAIYPNPISKQLNINIPIDLKNEKIVVRIFTSLGNKVMDVKNFDQSIDISFLATGSYFLQLQVNDLEITKKISKL